MSKNKVAIGMSGGVDSSVAARLLLEAGYEVVGLTMTIWDERIPLTEARQSGCFGPGEKDDVAAARESARALGIPHHIVPLAAEYRAKVLDPFCQGYLQGVTPNPCALCNPLMKFGALLEKARSMGLDFDRFATGHYARVQTDPASGQARLFRSRDRDKDQSYFLARLNQKQLREVLFPLGEIEKDDVRAQARSLGWHHAADKPESQDFFEGDDRSILFPEGALKPGPILDLNGKRLGMHRGIALYTVGQRAGLGVATGEKVYVQSIDAANNTLIVGPRDALTTDRCAVSDPAWIAGRPPHPKGFRAETRLRYRHPGVASTVTPSGDGMAQIVFDQPQWAVTPGQMAVFYDDDEVLGGGWIVR